VSEGIRYRLSFGISLGFHLGFLWGVFGFHLGVSRVSFRSLEIHLGYKKERIKNKAKEGEKNKRQ
jgi:hypothetical protein